MANTSNRNDMRLATSDGDDDYIHIVGDIQHWLDRLGLKIPRAMCGVLLVGDPDKPEPGANAATCPKCQSIAGPGERTFIPGKWR